MTAKNSQPGTQRHSTDLSGLDQNLPPREDGFNLLPAGQYVGQVIESDVAMTRAGTGTVLKLTWELTGVGYRGRRIWQSINLTNPNVYAKKRGEREVAALKRAVGIVGMLADHTDLHHRPVGLVVEIEPSKDPKYHDKNIVTGFFPADTSTPAYAVIKH